MGDLSFEIKSTRDFYEKLIGDYEDFLLDPESSTIAINCALTAWHLADWFYHENHQQVSTKYNTLQTFQAYIKTLCPELQIMHDIANGSKHLNLTKHKSKTKDTKLHKGAFSSAFSRGFDTSGLEVEMNDGSMHYFEDVIEVVVGFWEKFIDNPQL